MSSKWVEGVDFQLLPSGEVQCLHCSRTLKSKSAIGPHLVACTSRKEPTAPTPPSPEEEPLPTEEESLESMLKEMGVKRSRAIARLMSYSGWDNFEDLSNFLKLSGVSPDRVILCLEAWARHRGKTLPISLIQTLQTERQSQYYMPPPNPQTQQAGLTKEEVLAIMEEREKQKELEKLRNEVQELRTMLTKGNPNEFEELKRLLLERERNEVLTRLNKLEGYIMGGITNPYSLLGLTIRETADLIKNSPLRAYILTGQLPRLEKEIEPEARERIFERLNRKYVVESD